MQIHGGSFSNSFSIYKGQQIQLYTSLSESRQYKFSDIGNSTFRQEEYSTVEYFWNTSWLKSREHKFIAIGNSIFLQRRSGTAAKFSKGFTPYSLFSFNCREQKMVSSLLCGFSRKGYSLSRQCQFQKILSFPSVSDKHKSPFQEDVPITIK